MSHQSTYARKGAPIVILFSTTLGAWEAWQQGRPLARSSTPERLADRYPAAMPVSDAQRALAARYAEMLT